MGDRRDVHQFFLRRGRKSLLTIKTRVRPVCPHVVGLRFCVFVVPPSKWQERRALTVVGLVKASEHGAVNSVPAVPALVIFRPS